MFTIHAESLLYSVIIDTSVSEDRGTAEVRGNLRRVKSAPRPRGLQYIISNSHGERTILRLINWSHRIAYNVLEPGMDPAEEGK